MSSTNPRGRLPVARRDRRPLLATLAVLLILLGSLATALIVYRTDDRATVLVAADDITFGQLIEPSDFQEVRVSQDGGSSIPAGSVGSFLGTHATTSIPAGTIVHPKMFSVASPVPKGGQVVGVVLDPERMPSTRPVPGQVVRLYFVAGATTGGQLAASPGDTIVEAARVLAVGRGGGGGTISVSVLVRDIDAGVLADFASSGNIALSVLPDDTQPQIDSK